MDEARRFLRYIIPSAVFAVEIFIFLLILFPDWTLCKLSSIKEKEGLALVAASIFASGGLGYLFSSIHHTIRWWWCPVINHKELILSLTAGNFLALRNQADNTLIDQTTLKNLTLPDAWIIASTLWFNRLKTSEVIAGADSRTASLVDLSHSLGTLRISCVTAFMATLWIASNIGWFDLHCEPVLRFSAFIFLFFVLLCIHQCSHKKTALFAEGIINETLADVLIAERNRLGHPVETRVILGRDKR
ncbi:MAG: hypothetical protein HY232_13095 [Acidobacteria bacterium]|nr:hypothetical protein [Acidobacteriota bacterium]